MKVLGTDIGGSGIKGAPVDTTTGFLTALRHKELTPIPALPASVVAAVAKVASQFAGMDSMGCTFPGVVVDGVIRTAHNLDPSWVGVNAEELFSQATGLSVKVLNDADAAGLAEMRFGAGVGQRGTVLMLTFGTGIGSALFHGGLLIPNTEFGHIEIRGKDAERRASANARDRGHLSWAKWAARVEEYLKVMEALVWPDLIIIGGGISRKADRFIPLLTGVRTPIVPATLRNDAGIVGAAMAA